MEEENKNKNKEKDKNSEEPSEETQETGNRNSNAVTAATKHFRMRECPECKVKNMVHCERRNI